MSPLRLGWSILLLAAPALAMAAGKASPPKMLSGLEIVTEDDYPDDALRKEEEGSVVVRLDVDENGAVRGCKVARSSRSASLDETTCRLFQERARFTPAHDRRGRPVAGIWHSPPITWRITEADPVVDAATGKWLQCLYTAAKPHFEGPLTREEIADKAYAACPAEEEAMRSAMSKPDRPPFTSEDARREFRPVLLKMVDDARGGIRL